MGPMHFFGGELAIIPLLILAMFAVAFIIRALSGRGGFGKPGRRRHMRKGHRMGRRRIPFEEEYPDREKKPRPASTAKEDQPQAEPIKLTQSDQSLSSSNLRAHVDRATAYQEQINRLAKNTSNPHEQARLQALADQVGQWVNAIEDLAKRIDNFRQNSLIQQDLASVPQAIESLEDRLLEESTPATRAELERTLTNRKSQLAALEQLQDTINRAEIKIESTLSALGTIYSQALTTQSTDQVADYSRLAAEVDEEVRTLQDHLEALREVKLGNQGYQ